MGLLETTCVEVTAADVEKSGTMSSRRLLQLLILAAMDRNRVEGGSKIRLREQFGAVWMVRRVRMEQYAPIYEGDVLNGFATGRTMLTQEIALGGEFRRNGETVARIELVMIAVNLKERFKLKAADVNTLYQTEPTNEAEAFPRLAMDSEFPYVHERTITEADCDENANHFASHCYVDLVAQEVGVPADGMIRLLQIDYVKECVAGDTVRLGAKAVEGGYAVQGIHANGKPCFNAYCVYA